MLLKTSYKPISAEDVRNKNPPTSLTWLLLAQFVKEIVDIDTHDCEF